MDNKLTDAPQTEQVFWPKWHVKFNGGSGYGCPYKFDGVHLGTVAEKPSEVSTSIGKPKPRQRHFFPTLDMLYIDDYVFDFYEDPKAEIGFDTGGGLPKTLDVVEKVAINASSLSKSQEKDCIWLKKLRFILRNFKNVRAITVLTAVILDIPSPVSMPNPMYLMNIESTSIYDRMRHGILFGDALKLLPYNPETLRPSDFAIQEWDKLSTEWPMFGKRKANGSAPELYMGTMVFFGKEWVNLDSMRVRAPHAGHLCSLGCRSVDPMGAIIRRELDQLAQMNEGNRGLRGRRDMKKKPSKSFLKHKGSSLALLSKASVFLHQSQPPEGNLRTQKM
jgi:hypothetical protein